MQAEEMEEEDGEREGEWEQVTTLRQYVMCPRWVYWGQRGCNRRRVLGEVWRERGRRVHEEVLGWEVKEWSELLGVEVSRREVEVSMRGRRWSGRADMVVWVGDEPRVVEVKDARQTGHEGDVLQVVAYAELYEEVYGVRVRVGYVYDARKRLAREVEIREEDRERVRAMYGELRALREGVNFPETHAPPELCKACPYLGLCGDDLWIERSGPEVSDDEASIRYEVVMF